MTKREYNPGPATRAKGVGFYGHHRLGKARKAFKERERLAKAPLSNHAVDLYVNNNA